MQFLGNRLVFTLITLWVAGVCAGTYEPQKSNRETTRLDTGWLFNNTDNSSFSSGTGFNDGNWTKVCLPHANVITRHAYLDTASYKIITWYRKHFNPSALLSNRRFMLKFEGVAVIATVYVNGEMVGSPHKGAYTPFTIDITDKVRVGQDNVIAVKVDSRRHTEIPPEGRENLDFMVFGGIVRHVYMIAADPLHIDWTFVSTQNPSQSIPVNPTISAKTQITNKSGSQKTCTIITNIVDNDNNVVAMATSQTVIPANRSIAVDQITNPVSNPQLWSLDNPALYSVFVQLRDETGFVDEYRTRMGIRSLTINKTDGKCYLNGEAIKLRGLNRHETYPYIGRAASTRLQRKDAEILKYELGCNLVRAAHYPQSPDFLDRCDELGLLVLEEIPGWQYLGSGEWRDIAMQNLVDMVKRDRNHPCLLSFGCRVNESVDDTWYKSMNDTARALDPTRLTHGVRFSKGKDPAYRYEDIWTQNFYFPGADPPEIPFITTEFAGHTIVKQAHSWDDDHILINQITDNSYGHATGHNASYASDRWAGLVGWCAFDYNSPHRNSTYSDTGRNYMGYVSPHGVSNIFRLPKMAAYFYQSQRDPSLYGPMVHICNHWTPKSPGKVLVVSNCQEVELYRNEVLISKIKPNLYTSLPYPCFQWAGVSFEPGELKAIGYIGGVKAATHIVKTPGEPVGLTLVPDTNVLYLGGDMTRVVVTMVDQHGQILHASDDSVTLGANGAGDFLGETRTALEAGQMAFYVKTRALQTGAITCQASCRGFNATASIMVVEDPGITAVKHGPVIKSGDAQKKSGYYRFYGNRFIVPSWAIKDVSLRLFDCQGKLIFKSSNPGRILDLEKIGVSPGVHIVTITGNSIKKSIR